MKRQRYEAARALRTLAELRCQHERAQAELAAHAARRAGTRLDDARHGVSAQHQGLRQALDASHGIGFATWPLWAQELRLARQGCDEAERADREARDRVQRQQGAVQAAQARHDRVAAQCRHAHQRYLDQRDAQAVAERPLQGRDALED